jgi:hypothetical protein
MALQENTLTCQPPLSMEYVEEVDLIASGLVEKRMQSEETEIIISPDSVFKGFVDELIVIDTRISDFKFKTDTWYLIYANRLPSGRYKVDKCSRACEYTEAFADVKFLVQHVPCFDRRLIHNGVCHRSGVYVCGCDEKTYASACEARKKGVAAYSIGKCPDDK